MTRRRQQPDLVVRAHNVHNGNGQPEEAASAFVDAMHEFGAHIGVVTEAKALVYPLRRLARRQDLDLVAETPKGTPRPPAPVPEQGDTVLIVRDVVARRSRTKVMTRAWVVRQYQRWHEPRRDQLVMLRGPVRGVWGTHLPPGGPDDPINGPAWREQMESALKWAARGGCRAAVGDVNCSKEQLRAFLDQYKGPPRADRVRGAHIVGYGVDLAIIVGGRGVASKQGNHGSDHPVVVYGIVARGRVAAVRRWVRRGSRRGRSRRD